MGIGHIFLTTPDGIGGSEIFDVSTKNGNETYDYLNKGVMNYFKYYPIVKLAICVLLITLLIMLVMRLLSVRSIWMDRGVKRELSNINWLKTKEHNILRGNKFIKLAAKLSSAYGFRNSQAQSDYLKYNIKRAGYKVFGGVRYITPDEYSGVIRLVGFMLCAVSIVIGLFVSAMVGFIALIAFMFACNTMPMLVLRRTVAEKDREIKDNFSDLYLRIHYELLDGGDNPLTSIFESYGRTTTSLEMVRFVSDCVDTIDTYGEQQATSIIASDYREIAEVCKLMRLIGQMNTGADIRQELLGFRTALLKTQSYLIEKRKDRAYKKAKRSSVVLMVILVQAIISAMAIYIPDISSFKL